LNSSNYHKVPIKKLLQFIQDVGLLMKLLQGVAQQINTGSTVWVVNAHPSDSILFYSIYKSWHILPTIPDTQNV
jgi:hypothetical protein